MVSRKGFLLVVFLAAAWGFCFRTGERQAWAVAIPNPCNPSPCDDVCGWWTSTGVLTGSQCTAYEVTGTVTANGGTHTTTQSPQSFRLWPRPTRTPNRRATRSTAGLIPTTARPVGRWAESGSRPRKSPRREWARLVPPSTSSFALLEG